MNAIHTAARHATKAVAVVCHVHDVDHVDTKWGDGP